MKRWGQAVSDTSDPIEPPERCGGSGHRTVTHYRGATNHRAGEPYPATEPCPGCLDCEQPEPPDSRWNMFRWIDAPNGVPSQWMVTDDADYRHPNAEHQIVVPESRALEAERERDEAQQARDALRAVAERLEALSGTKRAHETSAHMLRANELEARAESAESLLASERTRAEGLLEDVIEKLERRAEGYQRNVWSSEERAIALREAVAIVRSALSHYKENP